eukprot:6235800-Amphidinium_carterae.2
MAIPALEGNDVRIAACMPLLPYAGNATESESKCQATIQSGGGSRYAAHILRTELELEEQI